MTNYVKATNFAAKDALASGNAAKQVLGTELDDEFNLLATASASKEDSANKGSANGYAPLDSSSDVPSANLPAASETVRGAAELASLAEAATGTDDIRIMTALKVATEIGTHNVTNRHIDHSAVSPLAGSGLDITGADITADFTYDLDLSGLPQANATDLDGAAEFVINDGGTNKAVRYQDFGIPQTDDATTTPFSAADLTFGNRWFNLNNASAIAVVIPANASVAYPVGTAFAFHQRGAGQVTVSVTTDTLRSPNGAKTAQQFSTIYVTKVAATEWVITGDSIT